MAGMEPAVLRRVVDAWVEQYVEIGARPEIHHVQIFENRGAMMGASNPHPHCQIWANRTPPNEIAKEQARQTEWRERRGGCLLCDYAEMEQPAERPAGGRERRFPGAGSVLGGVAV